MFAAPPSVTTGPSTTVDQKLCVPEAKKPDPGSTAATPFASSIVAVTGSSLYFFRLPGQCTSGVAWNTLMKRSFKLRVRLKLLTETAGDVNVDASSKISNR